MLGRKIFFFLVTGLALALSACARDVGLRGQLGGSASTLSGQESIIQPTYSGTYTLQCAVSLSAETVLNGQSVSITVTAAGGVAPYSIGNTVGQFTGQTSFLNSFANLSANNLLVSNSFTVTDTQGHLGLCSYQLTVLPSTAITNTGNGCTLSASQTSPTINNAFALTLTPTISTTYTVLSITYQSNWTVAYNSAQTTPVGVNVTYTSEGPRTITASVIENGQSYTCSLTLNVTNPQFNLIASAASVAIGGSISVQPVLLEMSSTPAPTISLVSSDSAIQIAQSGSNYLITANDSNPHSFTLTGTLTEIQSDGTTLTLTTTLALNFVTAAQLPLACQIVIPTNNTGFIINTQLTFSVVTATGDPVTFNTVVPSPDGMVGQSSGNNINVSFATVGDKIIHILGARSSVTGAICNGNGHIDQPLFVSQLTY